MSISIADSVVRVATEHCQTAYQKQKTDSLDGIVCCIHTEGSTEGVLNNRDKILRTLAGFLVHPNVGAGIVVTNDRYPFFPPFSAATPFPAKPSKRSCAPKDSTPRLSHFIG